MHNVATAECCFEERSEFVIFVTPGKSWASHETLNDISMRQIDSLRNMFILMELLRLFIRRSIYC